MVSFDDEEFDYNKTTEHRNLAEFSKKTVEEIKALEQCNPNEYAKLLAEYTAWCLDKFNQRCFNFNEIEKHKSLLDEDDCGLTF